MYHSFTLFGHPLTAVLEDRSGSIHKVRFPESITYWGWVPELPPDAIDLPNSCPLELVELLAFRKLVRLPEHDLV